MIILVIKRLLKGLKNVEKNGDDLKQITKKIINELKEYRW